jgi:NADH:ubiquinone oxidoreductase subunit F (NADH-binding)
VTAPPGGPTRLLHGWATTGEPQDRTAHLTTWGPLPWVRVRDRAARSRAVLDAVRAAGLRGHGGAAFPVARKLVAVRSGRRDPVVVANACEGEPSSSKDEALCRLAPHLVLDGAVTAAMVVGASRVFVCAEDGSVAWGALATAAGERSGGPKVRVVAVPPGFVSSEESALVSFLNTRVALPTSKPPRVFERGVAGRPTYVGNVETLAHLALVTRFGPSWFREQGTEQSPGTTLATVDGAVRTPGVVEIPYGLTLGDVLDHAGGLRAPTQAMLVGGAAGTWLPAQPALRTAFSHEGLAAVRASVGVASVLVLPAASCGVAETARLLRYLAGESARQCGPCMFGLPAIADDFAVLAAGATRNDRQVLDRLRRRLGVIAGRGACAHPDGAVRLAASALEVFADDVARHADGRPCPHAGARSAVPWAIHPARNTQATRVARAAQGASR